MAPLHVATLTVQRELTFPPRMMDHDTYSAHNAIGKVYIPLSSLANDRSNHNSGILDGWFPIYDTLHGEGGERGGREDERGEREGEKREEGGRVRRERMEGENREEGGREERRGEREGEKRE